jgi:hypothetical protein
MKKQDILAAVQKHREATEDVIVARDAVYLAKQDYEHSGSVAARLAYTAAQTAYRAAIDAFDVTKAALFAASDRADI